MTGCQAIREAIQAHLDDDLTPQERERFEAHLLGCPACRELVAGYRRLFAALDEPSIPEVPAGLVAGTMGRLAAARRRRQRWQAWVTAAAILIVGSAALLLAWDELAPTAWADVGSLAPAEVWSAVWETTVELVESLTARGGEWLSTLPGGPVAMVVLLAMLGANFLLAYRWRALARVNSGEQARVLQ